MISFYFETAINLTSVIISLCIVILTTGITYYLFTVRPKKKRKKLLKDRLNSFRYDLNDHVLEGKEEFNKSYTLSKEKVNPDDQEEDQNLVQHYIEIRDWSTFISKFRYMLLLDTTFEDYWNGKELMLLVNNLVMDDRRYIALSEKLTELKSQIKRTDLLMGEMREGIWKVKTKSDLIKNEKDEEQIHLVVSSMKKTQRVAHEIVQEIEKLLD